MDTRLEKNKLLGRGIVVFAAALFLLLLLLLPGDRVSAETIKYYAGAGVVSSSAETGENGKLTLTKAAYRKGYVLKFWNTKKNGKGKNYKPGKTYTFKKNQKLFAVWKKKSSASPADVNTAEVKKGMATSGCSVEVDGTVSFETEAKDTTLYLVSVNRVNGAVEYTLDAIEEPGKGQSVHFSLAITGGSVQGHADRYYCMAQSVKNGVPADEVKFHIMVAKLGLAAYGSDSKLHLLGAAAYVSHPEQTENDSAFFTGKNKKGIQGAAGAVETNCGHVFLNLYAGDVVKHKGAKGASLYEYNGKKYYFDPTYALAIIGQAMEFEKKDIAVTYQVMLNYTSDTKNMIYSKARKPGSFLYCWEDKQQAGREKIEAFFAYLAEAMYLYGSPHVSEVILGNEVNSYKAYQYKGSMSKAEFQRSYAETYRTLYNSVTSINPKARVYACVDQNWSKNSYGYPAKSFLSGFASKINAMKSDIKWNLAFHPYSHPLTDTVYWDSDPEVTDSASTRYITMKNIEVLTDYMKSKWPEAHIILSEIGYDASPGEDKQAEALKRTFNAVKANDSLDYITIRSYTDDPNDGGLKLGIKGRKAYSVWKELE